MTTSGVEYLTNNLSTVRNVSCVLEVVLCAGAVSSPAILMRSGIGPKEQLEEHGVSSGFASISCLSTGFILNFVDYICFRFEPFQIKKLERI